MELLPTFGLISDIVVFDVDNYFIVCEVLLTECFNHHYHSYEVSHDTTPSYVFVKQPNLADHCILGLYKKNRSLFVTLKYHIIVGNTL